MRRFLQIGLILGCLFASSLQAQQAAGDIVTTLGLTEAERPVSETEGWSKARHIVVFGNLFDSATVNSVAPDAEVTTVEFGDFANPALQTADVVIGWCSREVVGAAPKLRWLQHYAAGVENCVSIDALTERNILLTNMQKASSPAIAEHAIAMMFALARRFPEYIGYQQTGEWRRGELGRSNHYELAGKTMLVYGLGGIGTEIAKRAAALGMQVIAIRNSSRTGPDFVAEVGLPEDLLAVAARADVIANAAPLTPNTRRVLNDEFFAVLKPTALFINVGRGGTVDTDALVAALKSGKLAGAGLDVTDPEPLPADHALWTLPNVLITPHVAGVSDNDYQRYRAIILENLKRYQSGGKMLNVVDLERGY